MPPSSRAQQQAIARLHQMSCLDYNGPQLIESVFQQLHRVIGFDGGGYFYPGADGELETHHENPMHAATMADYFDPCMLASELQVFHRSLRRFTDVVRHEHGPRVLEQLIKVPYAQLLRSDFYNVLLRPLGVSNWVNLTLRTPQGQGIGMLALYRHSGAPPFGPGDIATLARLEACLARALQPGELDAEGSVVAERGLLVATPLGRLLWISPEAERLMPLAFGWRWRGRDGGTQLPLALQLLLQRLQWVWRAPEGTPGAALPQMEWRNAGGWFSLRATRLTPAAGEAQAVAIHITQRIPRAARLLQALLPLALPPRQHELAYWIASGWSESQIAARMGVGMPTVVHHRRALYERLGARSRRELLAMLHIS